MCSTPNYQVSSYQPLATPTLADASVQKSVAKSRRSAIAVSNRNIKTSYLGVLNEATTSNKKLLGE